MSGNNEPITPADVPLSRKQEPQSNDHRSGAALPRAVEQPQWYHNKRTVYALIALVLVAFIVIFTLPKLVSPVSQDPVAVQVVDSAPAGAELESPWQDAQLAKVRRKAQDILDRLLEKQSFLEKKGAESWAAEAFTEALALAAKGDQAYRSRSFDEAIQHYQQAELMLTELEQSIPVLLEQSLTEGTAALDTGDQTEATALFERALLLAPGNEQAQLGLQRAATISEISALMEQANTALQQGAAGEAVKLLKQAQAVDSHHEGVKNLLALAQQQQAQQQFQAAMSDGYEALDSGNLSGAVTGFKRALAINPNDEAANSGLQQALTRQANVYITNNLNRATEQESQENWQQAVASYQKIIDRDPSIIDARVGLIRSQARADLDRKIQKLLDDPGRLATPAVRNQGVALLADARGIDSAGDRLQAQIERLSALLDDAATPVSVQVHSDKKTQVTVFKHAELGRFTVKNISLKPGRYVAVGSRKGYQDVRVEFEVASGSQPSIEVICRDPV